MTEPQREQTLSAMSPEMRGLVQAVLSSGDSSWRAENQAKELAEALIRSEAEKQTMRQALEHVVCRQCGYAIRSVKPGGRPISCDACEYSRLTLSHALAGSTPQPCTACAEKQVELAKIRELWNLVRIETPDSTFTKMLDRVLSGSPADTQGPTQEEK